MAFEATYNGVGAGFAKPSGKNRFHKFKTKVVSLWEAMEQQVRHGFQSSTHPLYRLAAKQLEVYRSVSMPVRPGKRGRPKRSEREAWLMQNRIAQVAAASGGSQADAIDIFDPEGVGIAASTATTIPSLVKSPTRGAVSMGNEIKLSRQLIQQWTQSVNRLEVALSRSQPPVLPSPLHELHQIKLRTVHPGEWELLQPHYADALGKYLTQASSQATTSAHPQMLPSLLSGLDILRSGETDAANLSSINFAYRTVLIKYLDLTNPEVAASIEEERKHKASDPPETAVSPKRFAAADNEGDADGGANGGSMVV